MMHNGKFHVRRGNLWGKLSEVKVIPTNGDVSAQQLAVMGAGLAKQAAQMYPPLKTRLGNKIACCSRDETYIFPIPDEYASMLNTSILVCLPTKHSWRDNSSISLITRGLQRLVEYTNLFGWTDVEVPELGMGLGNLKKEEVYPLFDTMLDGRFTIVQYEEV